MNNVDVLRVFYEGLYVYIYIYVLCVCICMYVYVYINTLNSGKGLLSKSE